MGRTISFQCTLEKWRHSSQLATWIISPITKDTTRRQLFWLRPIRSLKDMSKFVKKELQWTNLFNPILSSFSSVAQSCLTLCDPMDCSMPGFPIHHHLPEFIQTHVHWVSDAIQPSHPLSSPSPPAFNLPSIRGFSNESFLRIRYWSFNFSISPSNEYSGLISFRMNWLNLFAVQGTLKKLLWHYSSNASILQCSAFFMVQLSHPLHDYWKNQSFD